MKPTRTPASAPAPAAAPSSAPAGPPLLQVDDLRVHYRSRAGGRRRTTVRAVDGVSFSVAGGETLGLVGESGCGKSTTGRAILQLVKPTGGSVTFEGRGLAGVGRRELKEVRRGMQAVFQDPYDSLNPRMTIEDVVGEPLTIHALARGEQRREKVGELLELVGLSPEMAARRPSELSGGQRQRVCIARALAVAPRFVVCDEAVSALDVSVQAQVLNLLSSLQRDLGLSYLFIGHDLSVVRHVSDRVAVMYAGQIVESADSERLYAQPYHPYTVSLLASSPVADPRVERERPFVAASGEPPNPGDVPRGCRFASRCPLARARCRSEAPAYIEAEPGRMVACHYWADVAASGRPTAARA